MSLLSNSLNIQTFFYCKEKSGDRKTSSAVLQHFTPNAMKLVPDYDSGEDSDMDCDVDNDVVALPETNLQAKVLFCPHLC